MASRKDEQSKGSLNSLCILTGDQWPIKGSLEDTTVAGRQCNLAQVTSNQEGVEEEQSHCDIMGTGPGKLQEMAGGKRAW